MGCENLSPPSNKSTLAWRIPWTEEPGGLQSMGLLQVGINWATSLSHISEGNGNPLQCSCPENPRDGGAWWAAVYGVAQSRTWLKRLSSSSSSSNKRDGMTPTHLRFDMMKKAKRDFLLKKAKLQMSRGNATLTICPTFSFPHCVHKSILYVCISIPSLQRTVALAYIHCHV